MDGGRVGLWMVEWLVGQWSKLGIYGWKDGQVIYLLSGLANNKCANGLFEFHLLKQISQLCFYVCCFFVS